MALPLAIGTSAERDLVTSTLSNGSRAVPGSVVVAADGMLTWTEACRSQCPHSDRACHTARSALLPRAAIRAARGGEPS